MHIYSLGLGLDSEITVTELLSYVNVWKYHTLRLLEETPELCSWLSILKASNIGSMSKCRFASIITASAFVSCQLCIMTPLGQSKMSRWSLKVCDAVRS